MKFTAIAALLAAATVSTAADAALFQFDITGGYTASFAIASETVPNKADDNSATFYDVQGSYQDTKDTVANVEFFVAGSGGGLELTDFISDDAGSVFLFNGFGEQLFTGTPGRPMFRTGRFALLAFDPNLPASLKTAAGGTDPVACITISDMAGAVPEPASWAMMIGGIGMAGGMMRRRRATVRVAYA